MAAAQLPSDRQGQSHVKSVPITTRIFLRALLPPRQALTCPVPAGSPPPGDKGHRAAQTRGWDILLQASSSGSLPLLKTPCGLQNKSDLQTIPQKPVTSEDRSLGSCPKAAHPPPSSSTISPPSSTRDHPCQRCAHLSSQGLWKTQLSPLAWALLLLYRLLRVGGSRFIRRMKAKQKRSSTVALLEPFRVRTAASRTRGNGIPWPAQARLSRMPPPRQRPPPRGDTPEGQSCQRQPCFLQSKAQAGGTGTLAPCTPFRDTHTPHSVSWGCPRQGGWPWGTASRWEGHGDDDTRCPCYPQKGRRRLAPPPLSLPKGGK